MPAWEGKPPIDDKPGGKIKMLKPGTYEAVIADVEPTTDRFTNAEQVCITYEVEGEGTIRQWVTAEIEPDSKGRWVFFKIMGASDFPSEEYWKAAERESREWNPLQDLRDCSDTERTLILTVESYEKKDGGGTGTRVDSKGFASPRRNPAQAKHTGPEKATVEPEDFISKDEVPF